MLYDPRYAFLDTAAFIVGCLLLLTAWRAPRLARSLFVGLFAGAAAANLATALAMPSALVDTSPIVAAPMIRDALASEARLVASAMATAQALVAAGLLAGGQRGRIAAVFASAMLCGAAVVGAPPGLFTTLLLAVGVLSLVRGATLAGSLLPRPGTRLFPARAQAGRISG